MNSKTILRVIPKTFFHQVHLLFLFLVLFFYTTGLHAQWNQIGLNNDTINCLNSQGSSVFAVPNRNVYRSTNMGTNWGNLTAALFDGFGGFNSIALSGSTIFLGSTSDLFRSTDNGTSWTDVWMTPLDANVSSLTVSGTNIIAGLSTYGRNSLLEGGVMLSTDDGTTWPQLTPFGCNVASITSAGDNIFAGTYYYYINNNYLNPYFGSLYRSTNLGKDWTIVYNNFSSKASVISLIAVGTNIFAGTDSNGVYLSTDNGTTWGQANNGLTTYVNSFAVSGASIFAGTSKGVFVSTNNGANWTSVNDGLSNTKVHSLVVSGINIIAGTEAGVWMRPVSDIIQPVELTSFSSNVTLNNIVLKWKTATEVNASKFEIEKKSIDAIWIKVGELKATGNSNSPKRYYFTDKNLNAGKHSYRLKMIDNDGTFKYSDEIQADISLPKEFSLSQNYPNPFNPTTLINYQLPQKEYVTLKIYDMLGREVATLINGYKEQGRYSIVFDGNEFASGVYVYQLKAGEYISIKKMSLVK